MIISRRQDIERFIARPDPQVRGALIYGKDTGVVRDRGAGLASRITERPDDPFDVALLTDADIDADPARLEAELAAQSLMGGRRMVRLRLSSEKTSLDRAAGEAIAAHAQGRFNPDAFFIIEAGALGKASEARKAAEKAANFVALPCYEDEPGDIARLVRDTLSQEGVALTSEALALFVARLPRERGVARQEIERLVLYLGPGSNQNAGPKDLEAFLGVEPETSLADAASDAFGGRVAEVQAGLRRAAQEGEQGAAAVRAMSQHLARLRRILTLSKAGAGLQEAAKASGVFWKNEREVLRQARAWSLDEIDRIQPELLRADRQCKQTGSPDQMIAERLALQIAGRARRLGL